MPAKAISLAEYAQAHPASRGRACAVCSLPKDIKEQVDEHLRAKQVSRGTIHRWLTQIAIKAPFPRASLDNHVANGHVDGYER